MLCNSVYTTTKIIWGGLRQFSFQLPFPFCINNSRFLLDLLAWPFCCVNVAGRGRAFSIYHASLHSRQISYSTSAKTPVGQSASIFHSVMNAGSWVLGLGAGTGQTMIFRKLCGLLCLRSSTFLVSIRSTGTFVFG